MTLDEVERLLRREFSVAFEARACALVFGGGSLDLFVLPEPGAGGDYVLVLSIWGDGGPAVQFRGSFIADGPLAGAVDFPGEAAALTLRIAARAIELVGDDDPTELAIESPRIVLPLSDRRLRSRRDSTARGLPQITGGFWA